MNPNVKQVFDLGKLSTEAFAFLTKSGSKDISCRLVYEKGEPVGVDFRVNEITGDCWDSEHEPMTAEEMAQLEGCTVEEAQETIDAMGVPEVCDVDSAFDTAVTPCIKFTPFAHNKPETWPRDGDDCFVIFVGCNGPHVDADVWSSKRRDFAFHSPSAVVATAPLKIPVPKAFKNAEHPE